MNTKFIVLVLLIFNSVVVFSQGKARFTINGQKFIKSNAWRDDLPQDEISSEMHKNNIGKIVFSSDKIEFKNEDPSKIKSIFTPDENIYARAYMLSSLQNDTIVQNDEFKPGSIMYGVVLDMFKKPKILVKRGPKYNSGAGIEYKLYINGELSNWNIEGRVGMTKKGLTATTRQIWIAPKPEDDKVDGAWIEILEKLPEGENTLKIEAYGYDGGFYGYRPLAQGEFKIIKGDNANVSTGVKFSELKEGKKDEVLTSKLLSTIQGVAKTEGWKENFSKIKIESGDWTEKEEGTSGGFKKVREIIAYAYATYNGESRCTVQKFIFYQNYNGSSYSGDIFLGGVASGKERIDCVN